MPIYHVGGMEFYDEETAKMAERELQYIAYIKSKHNLKDSTAAKQLYQQFVTQGAFKTKIGEQFLNSLMDSAYLTSSNRFENYQPRNRLAGNYTLAAPVDRLIANVIDSGILVIIWISIFFLHYIPISYIPIIGYYLYALLGWVAFLIPIVIQLYFWNEATTIGMSVMKLTCVNKDNYQPLSLGYMAAKNIIGAFISLIVFCLGYIWILIDKDNQGWHDKLVNGIVIKNE